MACDMIVALGPATSGGSTYFGVNLHRPAQEQLRLRVYPGAPHALGEKIETATFCLPQAQQTYTVLGVQPAGGWGFYHGINEHHIAIGCSNWRSILTNDMPGLAGVDIVRLVLERSCTARQAVDLITDLISRHGQGQVQGPNGLWGEDNIFLITDPKEAYVIEAADSYWAMQEIHEVRAVSDVSVIRQDWNRLSLGLGDYTIREGWWPEDGTKINFAGCMNLQPVGEESALRRWGRATFLLESASGSIDQPVLRRLFSDHYEGTRYEVDPHGGKMEPMPICRHGQGMDGYRSTSMLVELAPQCGKPIVAWWAFGPPCMSVYFPIILIAEAIEQVFAAPAQAQEPSFDPWAVWNSLQQFIQNDHNRAELVRERIHWLQTRLDQEADEFLQEIESLQREGDTASIKRLARVLMEHHLEEVEQALHDMGAQLPVYAPSVLLT